MEDEVYVDRILATNREGAERVLRLVSRYFDVSVVPSEKGKVRKTGLIPRSQNVNF